MNEKNDIISRAILDALEIQAPVVWLENDVEDFNDLKKDGEFTLLPNMETQPENLVKACKMVLKNNGDKNGLSAFNACFDKLYVKSIMEFVLTKFWPKIPSS